MKRAIIYYSLSNNTKATAEKLAEVLEADLYRIDFLHPLPKSKAGQMLEGGRQVTFGVKPPITGVPQKIFRYDDIILGTPIWAGKYASPFNTLLENVALCDRVTAVFTYSGGGDNENCIKAFQKILPKLKYDVALADSKSKYASENEKKTEEFIKQILDGET